MPPLRVGVTHPGKASMKVSTLEIFLNHFIHDRAIEAIQFFTMLIIDGFGIVIVVVQYLPQGRIGGLSGMADR
jgi:hypothetical protein